MHINVSGDVLFSYVKPDYAEQIRRKRHKCKSTGCLQYAIRENHLFVAAGDRQTKYDLPKLYSNHEGPLLYSLPRALFAIELIMVTRKGYPILEKFDYWILRIIESGFLRDWEKKFSTHTSNITHQQKHGQLGLQHLLVAFILLIFGITVSISIFLVEINIEIFKNITNKLPDIF